VSPPPETKHYAIRQQHRLLAAQTRDVLVPSVTLIELLDYIDELEARDYASWETAMGEDL
jgi:hypothetical protein